MLYDDQEPPIGDREARSLIPFVLLISFIAAVGIMLIASAVLHR